LDKLPESIGDLTKLESINLYQCKLIKSLPPSSSNLSNLKILDLSYTVIPELPAAIFELTSLVELKLFQLPITILSPAIKYLENLEYLDLRLTKITEFPSEIGELKKLKKVHGCTLHKALPDSFCNLINLKELEVNFENVERALPESFGNLINLERFDPGNNISYLPASFGKLSKLKTLTLRNLTFTEIPMVLTELHNLKSLDLWDNKFADVPNELTNLKSLDLIRFNNNPLASSNSIQKKCKALLPGVYFYF
jgi:Leucine-rich repeat (LRR) protein